MLTRLKFPNFYEAIAHIHLQNTKPQNLIYTIPEKPYLLFNGSKTILAPSQKTLEELNLKLVSIACNLKTPVGVDQSTSLIRINLSEGTAPDLNDFVDLVHREICHSQGKTYLTRDNFVINEQVLNHVVKSRRLVGILNLERQCLSLILNPNQQLVEHIGFRHQENLLPRYFMEQQLANLEQSDTNSSNVTSANSGEIERVTYDFLHQCGTHLGVTDLKFQIQSSLDSSIKQKVRSFRATTYATESIKTTIPYPVGSEHSLEATLLYQPKSGSGLTPSSQLFQILNCSLNASVYGTGILDRVRKTLSSGVIKKSGFDSFTEANCQIVLDDESPQSYQEMEIVQLLKEALEQKIANQMGKQKNLETLYKENGHPSDYEEAV